MAVCLIAAMSAGGCAERSVRPVTVEVSVPVLCKPPVVLHPVWPFEAVDARADFSAKIRALLAEMELRKAYEARLRAALAVCAAP